jgi:hypothetical protein
MVLQFKKSFLLEQRISNYTQRLQVDEVGRVVSVGYGIARVYGLNNIQAGEMGVKGMALNLESENVGIITRKSLHEPMQTGLKAMDNLTTIGRLGVKEVGRVASIGNKIGGNQGKKNKQSEARQRFKAPRPRPFYSFFKSMFLCFSYVFFPAFFLIRTCMFFLSLGGVKMHFNRLSWGQNSGDGKKDPNELDDFISQYGGIDQPPTLVMVMEGHNRELSPAGRAAADRAAARDGGAPNAPGGGQQQDALPAADRAAARDGGGPNAPGGGQQQDALPAGGGAAAHGGVDQIPTVEPHAPNVPEGVANAAEAIRPFNFTLFNIQPTPPYSFDSLHQMPVGNFAAQQMREAAFQPLRGDARLNAINDRITQLHDSMQRLYERPLMDAAAHRQMAEELQRQLNDNIRNQFNEMNRQLAQNLQQQAAQHTIPPVVPPVDPGAVPVAAGETTRILVQMAPAAQGAANNGHPTAPYDLLREMGQSMMAHPFYTLFGAALVIVLVRNLDSMTRTGDAFFNWWSRSFDARGERANTILTGQGIDNRDVNREWVEVCRRLMRKGERIITPAVSTVTFSGAAALVRRLCGPRGLGRALPPRMVPLGALFGLILGGLIDLLDTPGGAGSSSSGDGAGPSSSGDGAGASGSFNLCSTSETTSFDWLSSDPFIQWLEQLGLYDVGQYRHYILLGLFVFSPLTRFYFCASFIQTKLCAENFLFAGSLMDNLTLCLVEGSSPLASLFFQIFILSLLPTLCFLKCLSLYLQIKEEKETWESSGPTLYTFFLVGLGILIVLCLYLLWCTLIYHSHNF